MAATKRVRSRLSEAQGHRCCYCGIRLIDIPGQHNSETLEHVIPKAVDDWNAYINVVAACRFCNEGRSLMLAMSYFGSVRKCGRDEAYRLGQQWRKRIANGDPLRLRETAIAQHKQAKLPRVLAAAYQEYLKVRSD